MYLQHLFILHFEDRCRLLTISYLALTKSVSRSLRLGAQLGNSIPGIIYYPGIAIFFKVYPGILGLIPGFGNRKIQ